MYFWLFGGAKICLTLFDLLIYTFQNCQSSLRFCLLGIPRMIFAAIKFFCVTYDYSKKLGNLEIFCEFCAMFKFCIFREKSLQIDR